MYSVHSVFTLNQIFCIWTPIAPCILSGYKMSTDPCLLKIRHSHRFVVVVIQFIRRWKPHTVKTFLCPWWYFSPNSYARFSMSSYISNILSVTSPLWSKNTIYFVNITVRGKSSKDHAAITVNKVKNQHQILLMPPWRKKLLCGSFNTKFRMFLIFNSNFFFVFLLLPLKISQLRQTDSIYRALIGGSLNK